jgi:hypothetical protein
MENWKPIKGYEGKYAVSDKGRVRSLDRKTSHKKYIAMRNGRIMKPPLDKDGYRRIQLSKEGIGKEYRVHRLVAEAFIHNTKNLPIINHLNNQPGDNRVENLEWASYKRNSEHRDSQGRQGEHPYQKQIGQFTLNGAFIRAFKGLRIAKRETGINNIDAVIRGTQKQSGGYKWKYI